MADSDKTPNKEDPDDKILNEIQKSMKENILEKKDWLDKIIELEDKIDKEDYTPYTYKKMKDGSIQVLRHGLIMYRTDRPEEEIKKELAVFNDCYKVGWGFCHSEILEIIFDWLDGDDEDCDNCDMKDECGGKD